MKLFLQTILCFAFAVGVFAQGYGRRRPRPVVKPIVDPKPVVHKPPYTPGDTFNPMFDPFRGGGLDVMPEEVRRVIGSTISGQHIMGGMGGFPRHGGTLNENGLVNGWGDDANIPVIPEVTMWNDPLRGAAFPSDYQGQELYDPVTGESLFNHGGAVGHQIAKETHVAAKTGGVGHQIAKETHVAAKTGGVVTGGVPSIHQAVKTEHNIAKEVNHAARKNMAGVPAGPAGGFVNSAGFVGVDPVGAGLDPFGQVPSGQFFPNDPNHGLIKTGRHIGMSQMGTINTGHVAVDPPAVIAHNIRTATMGAAAVAGHNEAKAFGPPAGVGFINPSGSIAGQIAHDSHKHASGVIVDPFHGQAKAASGMGIRPIGIPTDPVMDVKMVGHSGMAGMGHDPLASSIGHGIAKQAVGEAAKAIDIGSRGGVSAGNPVALGATRALAEESLHVAGKTMGLASSGVVGGRHINAGMDIFGHGSIVGHHPKPVQKPIPKITGYGRRHRI